MKKSIFRPCAVLLCILVSMYFLPSAVFAAESIDISADVVFSISYTDESAALSDVTFSVYRVADTDENAVLTLTQAFAGYPIDLGVDQSEWQAAAATLKGYIERDNVTPDASAVTDSLGSAQLVLKPGVFLVLGSTCELDGFTYTVTPFLVMLPGLSADGSSWNYNVHAAPKCGKTQTPSEDGTVMRKVLKIWDDAGYEQSRPAQVTVQLLCDGEIYDTVTLDSSNNWRCTWDDLENGHEWSAVEAAVSGYTATVAQEGITFTITNTYNVPTLPEQPSDTDSGTQGGIDSEIPKTGQLWWPVFPLFGCGLLFVMVGMLRRRGA